MRITSLRELHRLKLGPPIEVSKAGAFYKARYAGAASFVFGNSPEEAKQRLLNTPSRVVKNSHRNSAIREMNWAFGFRQGRRIKEAN